MTQEFGGHDPFAEWASQNAQMLNKLKLMMPPLIKENTTLSETSKLYTLPVTEDLSKVCGLTSLQIYLNKIAYTDEELKLFSGPEVFAQVRLTLSFNDESLGEDISRVSAVSYKLFISSRITASYVPQLQDLPVDFEIFKVQKIDFHRQTMTIGPSASKTN